MSKREINQRLGILDSLVGKNYQVSWFQNRSESGHWFSRWYFYHKEHGSMDVYFSNYPKALEWAAMWNYGINNEGK